MVTITKKHEEALKELIKRYENIDLKTIKGAYNHKARARYSSNGITTLGTDTLSALTGFGSYSTCTLCKTASCANCIHGSDIFFHRMSKR